MTQPHLKADMSTFVLNQIMPRIPSPSIDYFMLWFSRVVRGINDQIYLNYQLSRLDWKCWIGYLLINYIVLKIDYAENCSHNVHEIEDIEKVKSLLYKCSKEAVTFFKANEKRLEELMKQRKGVRNYFSTLESFDSKYEEEQSIRQYYEENVTENKEIFDDFSHAQFRHA